MRSVVVSCSLVLCALWSAPARAEAPSIVHTPVGETTTAGPLILEVELRHPELVSRADVHWRAGGRGRFRTTRVRRSTTLPRWAAVVPRPDADVRTLEYWVTLTDRSG